jgi:hypothetical protein
MKSEKILAWHFLAEDGRLQFPPRRLVQVGRSYSAKGALVLCKNGMHASIRAIDALLYAPGALVCRVELSGPMLRCPDKLCAQRRKVLAMGDATETLHLFACLEGEMALNAAEKRGEKIDAHSRQAIAVKRRWLKKEATTEELTAARDAARAAAWDTEETASCAAWGATWAAIWAAAETASSAARAAARAAAWGATWAAIWAAAETASSAARAAARAATWDAANSRLETQLRTLLALEAA